MNRFLLAAAVVALASPAFATERGGNYSNSTAISQSRSNSHSSSTSRSNANNAGNNQNTSFNDKRQAPGIALGSLTSGADTCLGSAQAGVSGPGFGFLFGSTTEDKPCNVRKNSMLLHSLGQRRAAVEVLCKNIDMNQALAVGGYRCTLDPDGYTRVK